MEEHIWQADANSMLSSTIGRVMNTLLSSRPRKLQDAISRIGTTSQRSSGVSLEESLCLLWKYVGDAVDKRELLDQILVPMIESSLKCKDSKHCSQVMILLNWLFQDEIFFQALASNLAEIITRKDDRYISLGWCTLIRGLIEYEITMNQFSSNGIREKHNILLKIICPSISRLSFIACSGSTLQDGFELPTRLSVAAADCILVLTVALTKKALISENSSNRTKSSDPNPADRLITLVPSGGENRVKSPGRFTQVPGDMEMEFLLWDHLDELIILVQKLRNWSRKGRPLHAKGLEQVLKWLQETKGHYASVQDEAGTNILKTGVLLLSSCWKHYGMLLHLQDHRLSQSCWEYLNQYISGLQLYMDDYDDEYSGNKDSSIETQKFFLNCISLLLGRLDSKRFEMAMSEYGLQISRLLLSQLQCMDGDVIEGTVCILREIILKTNYSSTGSNLLDAQQMKAVLPLLLNLLDERESPARAVVILTAECCSINRDGQCLQEVLKRLASGNLLQRRNAIDVISELIRISLDSVDLLSPSMWQDISKHLLERLGDEELMIRVHVSNLFPKIDPPLVLPALVHLVYAPDERVQSSASDAIVAVLKYRNQNVEAIVMLLDCLSNLFQGLDLAKAPGEIGEGSKLDTDRVLRLIPKWSKSVQDWNILIEPFIEKLFAEPSNAIMVRFLSYISEHLAEAADVVLHLVLSYMQGQKEMDENFFSGWRSEGYTNDDSIKLQQSLFNRLCPLLIIRLLPLRVFNDLTSSAMYGQFLNQEIMHGSEDFNMNCNKCIAALLVNRAFHKFEFEDVRKLAAELCGRIHPQVLFPIILSQLEHATDSRDILKMKACLFSVCTSLVVRGRDSALHPVMPKIRKILEMVLLWPSLDEDEVSKAQHGCIDCLALMICAEIQAPESSEDSIQNKISIGENSLSGGAGNSVLSYVIQQLTHDRSEYLLSAKLSDESDSDRKSLDTLCGFDTLVPLSFRLCMANVLISAFQKISSSGKNPFAQRTLPDLVHSVEVITDSEIRAACIQVLFSAVYHLKSAVLPYSSDLLKLSVKALRKGSLKERMAGAKLMASLMASEDAIVENISGGLLEARLVLSSISSMDPSFELRQVCEKLLACITSPMDKVLHNLSL